MTEFSRAAGGIIIGDHGDIILVQTRGGDGAWLFPKGHVDNDEQDLVTAVREIYEETGLADLEYLDDLGTYARPHIKPDGSYDETQQKEIHMFLFAAEPDAKLAPTMEVQEAKWVPYREIAEHIGNAKDRVWFASVFPRVREAVQRD